MCICGHNIFFRTDESLVAIQRAFHAHFILHWNDAVPKRIFSIDFQSRTASI